MNKRKLMISVITIVGIISILVGSLAYYRITVNGSIKGTTGSVVFNVTGFTNESTKEIVLKEGKIIPGDKGEFTLHLDATGSDVDMYVTLSIDRGTLPTNLKFYTTSDYKSELHKYYEFMDMSNQTKDITIYWYWNPYISNEEDSNFINNTDLTATIKLDAVQISEYAMMKNGYSNKTEFWNNSYRPYISTITFSKDITDLPTSCTGVDDLCWDVSYTSTQKRKVYAYLIDSGSNDLYNLYIVSEAPVFAPFSCNFLFSYFSNLTSIDFNDSFNTSKVTSMSSMFSGCSSLTSLDLSSFNTSEVLYMRDMFSECSFLLSLDLSNFNTLNVSSMRDMFGYCRTLIGLDLSSFNTSNVTDMGELFNYCESLANLNISSFDTSKATNMSYMFSCCSSLINLDLSNFNTSNITDMSNMFGGCSKLINLYLICFNTSKVANMSNMFSECSSLINLDLSNFNTSNVTNMNSMFRNCQVLTTTINIMSTGVTDYGYMFYNAATNEGALITVDYIADASALVDNMIATKSASSNVVKGVEI